MVAMAMDAWWRDEARQPLKQLEGREDEDGPAVGCRTGESVEESGIRRSQRLIAAHGMKTMEREGWSGTVADEPLEAVAVVLLDTDRGVDAEPTRTLPGEHVGGGGRVEEIVADEVPEHAFLHRAFELLPVARFELGCFAKVYAPLLGFRENPVEDDDVVVEVGVEAGPEAVQERDGADPALDCRRRSSGARGVQGGADRTEVVGLAPPRAAGQEGRSTSSAWARTRWPWSASWRRRGATGRPGVSQPRDADRRLHPGAGASALVSRRLGSYMCIMHMCMIHYRLVGAMGFIGRPEA